MAHITTNFSLRNAPVDEQNLSVSLQFVSSGVNRAPFFVPLDEYFYPNIVYPVLQL